MAHVSQLPCDGEGMCMLCGNKPADVDKLICGTCHTPWHVTCLSAVPETMESAMEWDCPDCTGDGGAAAVPDELVAAIRAIEADGTLSEEERARRRQELMAGQRCEGGGDSKGKRRKRGLNAVLELVTDGLTCAICYELPERPVTTPCGHNFCLKCFQKWINQGKRDCAMCRTKIDEKIANQPRINSALVVAIRRAKMSKSNDFIDPDKVQYFMHNQDLPDEAYTTERAKKSGQANAASGKIFVTTPSDHMGPIPAANDPLRNLGLLVGESWRDRLHCRQWGAHLPHVAGIAGQSKYGAQSVVLSGGYQDDEDHGEWFLYTGSGGRDLSGNRRTNKDQSFDQTFTKYNQALKLSCEKGYPIRVVRCHKEKRSSYVPEKGLRYDGIYRVEKCWRKVGKQGFKVCRYLFVRCDNSPAPWTSDLQGDKVRALPAIAELKLATDVFQREESPAWDYDEIEGRWKWLNSPPASKKPKTTSRPQGGEQRFKIVRKAQKVQDRNIKEQFLKDLACLHCKNVMAQPVTTPCGHNFCKQCLEFAFTGQTFERKRTCLGGRSLRSQKNVMKCPACPTDISDFLKNPQVNRKMESIIEGLCKEEEEEEEEDLSEASEKDCSDSGEDNSEENENPNLEAGNKRKRKNNTAQRGEEEGMLKKIEAENVISKVDDAGVGSPSSPLNLQI